MNILIPHSWLLEHLKTTADPQTIQQLLSLSGPSVERIYKTGSEQVYDIEVTTNRVDMMSVRGIAREAAVILTQNNMPATLHPLEKSLKTELTQPKVTADKAALPLPKITNNPELCNRITCVVLSAVTKAPTPAWMAERLKLVEQNVHDARIDITNYITHELGHPCHAFDYDKIMQLGGEIIITQATKGETFTTLDGTTYTTVGGEVVFKNNKGEIIDLPGIKGTANTAVDDNTNTILFWIESIPAKNIRFASMTHAIRTTAAQLNEKSVDPHLAETVLQYGTSLYQSLCNAVPASEVLDLFPNKQQPESILVAESHISRYLGLELPTVTMQTILESLGCEVETHATKKTLTVTPPTFRPDLTIPEDIIEEIARVYGYHALPSKLLDTAIPTNKPQNTFVLEKRMRHFLTALGWQEVYTYSMVSQELALQSGATLENHLVLQNPLSDDKIYLRQSLLPSLREVLEQNPLQSKTLSVFEVAHTYHPQKNQLPEQVPVLGLVSPCSFRELKGVIEALCRLFFVTDLYSEETAKDHSPYVQKATLYCKDAKEVSTAIGEIGVLQNNLMAASINLQSLQTVARKHPFYQPIPKTAPVIEDYTFSLPPATPIGAVIAHIQTLSDTIKKVELSDQYQNNASFRITYWDYSESLSNEAVEPLRRLVIESVATTYQGSLVGSIE